MQADLAASQGRNEELNRVNEELRKMLQAQKEWVAEERVAPPPSPPRTFPMPFSSEIMSAVVPPNLVGVKASFTRKKYAKSQDLLCAISLILLINSFLFTNTSQLHLRHLLLQVVF